MASSRCTYIYNCMIVCQHAQIEGALCHHYSVRDTNLLGHGSVGHLVNAVNKQRHGRASSLLYEGAITSRTRYW